jgi:hypothetical protein
MPDALSLDDLIRSRQHVLRNCQADLLRDFRLTLREVFNHRIKLAPSENNADARNLAL